MSAQELQQNTGFWEAIAESNEVDATPVTRKEMGFSGTLAEAVDKNMPKVKPLATIGNCLACEAVYVGFTFGNYTELGNGLCDLHWDECVTKMPHFASVDPDFKIWKSFGFSKFPN